MTEDAKRVIGSLNVAYDILDNLKFQIRGNYDYAVRSYEQQHAAGSNSTNVGKNGAWEYRKFADQLAYADAILTYDTTFGEDFSANATVGASYQKSKYGDGVGVASGVDGLIYPNEFYFQNIPSNVQISSIYGGEVIKEGLFFNAQLGYKEMLFLDISGRNDWASTLALTGNDSYFYPSIGLTALFHEIFQLPEVISFAKLRGSFTQVGNEVPYNRIFPQNSLNASGGVVRNTVKPFFDAKPEIINSTEFGIDMRFFNNRLGFDFTYYSLVSKDQFIQVPTTSGEGGFTTEFINAGEITNKGVELTINATPIRTDDFEWNTNINYSKNNNLIVDIGPDDEKVIDLGSSEGYAIKLKEGGKFNDMYTYVFERNDQGQILFSNGKPRKTKEMQLVGNADPTWAMGWNNNFTYKRFNLALFFTGNFGGKTFSQTESMLDGAGVSLRSADARDAGGVTVNGVDDVSGAAITTLDPETWFRAIGDRNGVGEPYVYDRTNVRLSQMALGYDFDMSNVSWVKGATLSFIGNNLLMIYNNAPYDPELAMSTNRNSQGLDNFNLPSTGSYGFNLKLTF